MFVIYDEIRLDPSVNSLRICESDWAINPKVHCMQHGPTKTMFEIGLDEKPIEGEPVTVTDFSARLFAIGDGCSLPPPDVIETLGREAIMLYLVAFGHAHRKEPVDAGIPEAMIRNACVC